MHYSYCHILLQIYFKFSTYVISLQLQNRHILEIENPHMCFDKTLLKNFINPFPAGSDLTLATSIEPDQLEVFTRPCTVIWPTSHLDFPKMIMDSSKMEDELFHL